jgi:predicted phosphodiesterase
MFQVADLMQDDLGVKLIFHLGDDYTDGQELSYGGYETRCVPGLWCPEYHEARIPNRIIEDVAGVKVSAAHASKDLRHTELSAAIILTGHTHEAAMELIGFSLYLNPGHLKGRKSRGERPSFCTIDIGEETITAAIHEIDGAVRVTKTVRRERLA